MKLQSLAIIFIIIIIPVSMVLSEYIDNLIETREIEMAYDTKLLNSTYDAIKAYQLNTVNNAFGDVTTQKVNDVEAAAKTFLNSLTSSFNYSGYNSNVMQEYVSAVVFTMYDGYYIYSPYTNVLTEIDSLTKDSTSYDPDFSKYGETRDGLKPYVYYNCRYHIDNDNDFVITYTLDNYITIQGIINGKYVYDCGYIYEIDTDNGIKKNPDDSYTYNGVTFSEGDTEELKEFVGNTEYSYVKINGKKYYLESGTDPANNVETDFTYRGSKITVNRDDKIFYIDKNGEKNYNQTKGYSDDPTKRRDTLEFLKYYVAIKYNKSSYEYFKRAYEFSKMVFGGGFRDDHYVDKAGSNDLSDDGYGLEDLRTLNAVIYGNTGDYDIYNNLSTDIVNIEEYGDFVIFGENGINIGQPSSNFEQHRKAVIRYVIETNLTTSIASFSSTAGTDFIMPKISDEDWELIQNDVCAISFMQGMSIASKKYNGYAVVANTLTNEYIDEGDIYVLIDENATGNKLYCKINDKGLTDSSYTIRSGLGYYPGIWKLNFELKQDATNRDETIIYQPMSYGSNEAYLGSYTSIMGTSGLEPIENGSIYSYMSDKGDLKNIYYKSLGRERWGAFNVNNINYELYQNSNGCDYYLNAYNVEYIG